MTTMKQIKLLLILVVLLLSGIHGVNATSSIYGPTGHDGPCYLPAFVFLTVACNNAGKFLLGEGINDGCCGDLLGWTKAHVQWCIELKAEATAGVGEL